MIRWLIALVLILSACSALQAQLPQEQKPLVVSRQAPRELVQQITVELEECRKAFPINIEAANDVCQVIKDFDLKKPVKMGVLREKMLAVGPGAIPVIDEILKSRDNSLRENAAFALHCLISNPENAPKENTPVDVLLAKLFHRTVFDKNSRVRDVAILGLSKLGYSKRGNLPEAMFGLQEALNDPDPKLKNKAKSHLETLEQVRQQQSNR